MNTPTPPRAESVNMRPPAVNELECVMVILGSARVACARDVGVNYGDGEPYVEGVEWSYVHIVRL